MKNLDYEKMLRKLIEIYAEQENIIVEVKIERRDPENGKTR